MMLGNLMIQTKREVPARDFLAAHQFNFIHRMLEIPGYKLPLLNISFENGDEFLFVFCHSFPSLRSLTIISTVVQSEFMEV